MHSKNVSTSHVGSKWAGKKFSIMWEGSELKHTLCPVYLGVILGQELFV